MFKHEVRSLPDLLATLQWVYRHQNEQGKSADELRSCIEFLLLLLHK